MKKIRFIAILVSLLVETMAFAVSETKWEKTTSIAVGDVVVLAYDDENVSKELSEVTSSGTTIGVVADYETSPAGTYPLTVVAGSAEGSFAFKTSEDTYLAWSSGNSLKTIDEVTDASSWTVSFTAAGAADIYNVGTPARKLQYNTGSPRFACYGNAGQKAPYLWKQVAEGSLPAPSITPSSGTFFETQTVTISAEDGATIYYTLDGTDPTTESTEYSEALSISETTTVKAIAEKDSKTSSVATVTITFGPVYDNFAAANTAATADRVVSRLTFTEALVLYVNGQNAYIQDATGAMMLYGTSTLKAGDKISGYVQGELYLYNGLPEVANFTLNAETVSSDNEIVPTVVDAAALAENPLAFVSQYVQVSPAKFAEDKAFSSQKKENANFTVGETALILRNNFKVEFSVQAAKEYTVAGIVTIYNSNIQLYPLSASDIAEIVVPEPIAEGTYYMYNTKAQGYLVGANNWGTQASLDPVSGIAVDLALLEDGKYTISTATSYGRFLGTDGYVDQDAFGWTIAKVAGQEGVFTIAHASKGYLQSQDGTTVLNFNETLTDAAYWQLLTKTDLEARFAGASEANPADATFYIQNPNFSRNASHSQWTGGATSSGDFQWGNGSNGNFNAQMWNGTFAIETTAADVPNGRYRMYIQGFYREGNIAPAAQNYPNETLRAHYSLNDVVGTFKSVFEEAGVPGNDGVDSNNLGVTPNNQTQVSTAFTNGLYENAPIVAEVTNHELTIRIYKDEVYQNDWTVWDNIRLQYIGGTNLDSYQEALANAVSAAEAIEGTIPQAAYEALAAVVNEQNKEYGTCEEYASAVAAITEATNAAKALQTVYADYFVVKAKVQTLKNQNVYTDETGAVATFDAAVAAQDAIVESAVNAASIRAAIDAVKAAGLSFISSVRLTGAFDLTEIYVVNATPNTNVSGWTVQGGSASFQANCGEFWNASGASIRQTISGLPAGYYTLTAIAFTRTNMVARLFANENTMNLATVESSVVNNRTQADVWFNNGNGVNELSFDLTEAGDVEIGLIADNTTNDHWMVWRSFQLKYVANTLDDYLTMVESMLADEFASAVYTKSYYSEVEEALAQVTVKEEADAFLNGTPLQSLRENVAAWTSFYSWYTTFRDNYYNKEITMGNTVADHAEDTKIGAAQELAALTEQTESWYEWYQAKDIEQNVTTEMILQMMEQCDSLYDLACLQIITRYITAGSDLSIYIKNPDFYSDGGTLNGWIVASGQNEYGHDNQTPRWYDNFHRVLECWNGDFNISQDFVLPRTGVYSISTHGFYRTADNQTLGAANAAWTIWCEANGENTGANESRAFFYADNLEKPLPNICNRTYTRAEIDAIGAAYDAEVAAKKPSRFSNRCDEFPYDFLLVEGSNEDGLFIPNGVYSADYVFNHPVYSQSYEAKFTFIATQGKTLRFGIKCENAGVPANDIGWTLFDQLTLTFDGADHAVLDPFMAEVVEQAKQVAEKPMNCDSLSALNTAIQIYETSTDADEIIAAYDAINDAIAPARHSALAYEPLVEAVQRLATETALYDDMEFNPVRDNAYTSIAEYNQALEDGIYKDDEVGAVIDQIDGIVEQLRNFDPLTYPWPINENELNILREVYDVAGQSQELKTSWSNIHSTEDIYSLNGVTSVGGRVLSVNLPGKNIGGDVLSLFLSLPYVQEINLRDNQISSEIETLITPNENLISLDISDNAITGNIGLMAQNAPHLNSLYASGNHLSQVSPPLPTSISTVYLDHQTIDEPIDYQSSYLLRDQLLDQIPTILLYNTYNHDYSDGLNAIVRDDDETPTWAAALNIDGNGMSLTTSSVASPIFRGQSGSVLSVVTSNGSHRFRMGYTFEQGDANFDCETDISDLQNLINYSLSESYQGLLNLTAIDLLADQDINIMDIVRMVNLLLDQDSQPAESRSSVGHEKVITDDGGEASLFFRDGKLVLSTSVPVAALDLLILCDHEQQMKWEFEDSGFQIRQRKGNGLTHVILYSTEGRNIPVGETILAALSTTSSVIQKAILVQQDGTKIKANIETTVPTRIDMAETNVPVVKMGQHGEIFVTTPVQLDQVTWTIHSFDGTCVTSGVCESLSPGCHSISVLPEGYRQVILRISSNQVSITKKISK